MSRNLSAIRGLRFSLRTALVCTALIALTLGWYRTVKEARTRNARLERELTNAVAQIHLAESRAAFQGGDRSNVKPTAKGGVLSGATLEGVNLRGIVIDGGSSAFQRTVFGHSDLSNVSLSGGAASFQAASFNHAILKNARLTGGGSSFQLATFEDADLSGAELTGNLQGISLKHAVCVGTTIVGSFQGARIDAVQFQMADLTGINNRNLASCYFEDPPTYDAETTFPEGFDPAANGWSEVPVDRSAAPFTAQP